MSAISDDTAALVAAKLTVAWATLKAQQSGMSSFNDNQGRVAIANTYTIFRNAVEEVDIGEAVKHPKPPRS